MADTVLDSLLLLFQLACVIVVVAYLLTRSRFFAEVLDERPSARTRLILILVFGALSVYGTVGGVEIMGGAIINVRDLGPMVAGLLGGPLVGVGAGLIGALYRATLDGFSVVPCCLATVLAGLFGGLIWLANGRRFPSTAVAVSFAVLMEGLHMLLVLALARPYEEAVALVGSVALPVILANAAGVLIFSVIFHNLRDERRVQAERDGLLREVERKQAELAIAAGIQRSFLPDTLPQIPGFEIAARSVMAREVGGDFFDAIPFEVMEMGGDRLGILIADVSGKGVPAALFMALSRVVVRVNAGWFRDRPGEAIGSANAAITADSRSGMFVTLFYGVLDAGRGRLVYVNAGHNPPLLFRAASETFTELPATGIAVGVDVDAAYRADEAELGPGDLLVLYTDGITEAENPAGEMFGEERLRGAVVGARGLPAGGVLDSVIGTVRAFAGDAPQADDITLMIVRAT
jgi:sigma-B regulation protein RsbU (phosphoserine phosphatase)